jgi:hypothetical protein
MQFKKWIENNPVLIKFDVYAHLLNKKAQIHSMIINLNKNADQKDCNHEVVAFNFAWQLQSNTSIKDIKHAFQSISTNNYEGPEKTFIMAKAIDETGHKLNLAFIRGDIDWYRMDVVYNNKETIIHYEEPDSSKNKGWDNDDDNDDKPTPKKPPQIEAPTNPYVLAN